MNLVAKRVVELWGNGTGTGTRLPAQHAIPDSDNATIVTATAVWKATAGDIFTCSGVQDSGGSLVISGTGVSTSKFAVRN